MPKKPLGVRILALFGGLFGVGNAAIVVLVLFGVIPAQIGGHPMSVEQWSRVSAPLHVVAALIGVLVGVGFWRGHAKSRHLVPLLFILVMAWVGGGMLMESFAGVPRIVLVRALVQAVVLGGVSVWYLFVKRNVREWFAELERRRAR